VDAAAQPGGISRGSLIKAGAAAALAVGAGSAGRVIADAHSAAGLQGPGIGKARGGSAYLRRSTYQPLVGSTFRVHVPGAKTLRVKLVEARALRGPGDAFSLLFRGRRSDVEGGLYRIEHPALGAFELFVSPVGRGVKGLDLEAVINRIAT
jgi:cystathionine beta-lyase family protein involved in aluminum resistance